MRGGDNGPAVLPGNPGKSDLLRRVKLPAADDEMVGLAIQLDEIQPQRPRACLQPDAAIRFARVNPTHGREMPLRDLVVSAYFFTGNAVFSKGRSFTTHHERITP